MCVCDCVCVLCVPPVCAIMHVWMQDCVLVVCDACMYVCMCVVLVRVYVCMRAVFMRVCMCVCMRSCMHVCVYDPRLGSMDVCVCVYV